MGELVEVPGLSVIESISKHSLMIAKIRKIILATKTKYQEVQIVEFEDFGRGLVLDGLIQSTEADEFIYHEALVHPVMVTHPSPRRVLIIGGGEGATLREVLKHSTVEKAVMVDIDGELIEFSKKYLEFMHKGSFYDPRAQVVIMDGREYVKKVAGKTFDVIILDLTDPYGPEIARKLYSKEFYSEVKRILKSDGIIVTQAGSSFFYPKTYTRVLNNIKAIFRKVREYWIWVPAFAYACNFITASDALDPAKLTANYVNEVLKNRGVKCRLYNGDLHEALFKTPILISKFSKE